MNFNQNVGVKKGNLESLILMAGAQILEAPVSGHGHNFMSEPKVTSNRQKGADKHCL